MPDKRFLDHVRKWLKDRDITPQCILISKPNFIITVLKNEHGQALICFYIPKLKGLGAGGVTVYYDLQALTAHLRNNVKDTFTNWVAQTHL